MAISYSDAGVNIDEANRAVARIKRLVRNTFSPDVLTGIGSFGAAFRLRGLKQPVLISSADGVGTKLKVAIAAQRHNTIGEDLVNHCVNDIMVQGAEPLFFLDYFATGKLSAVVTAQVIEGIARGCKANGCALIGGETAEMPGLYAEGDYDLAGFIVGAVEEKQMLTGAAIQAGDALLALPSTGLHTNGYSLARKLLFDVAGYSVDTRPDDSLRPAVEDLWGAGSVLALLDDVTLSPEARVAADAFRAVEATLDDALRSCASGGELADAGFAEDVDVAAQLDASHVVPVMDEGEFRANLA